MSKYFIYLLVLQKSQTQNIKYDPFLETEDAEAKAKNEENLAKIV